MRGQGVQLNWETSISQTQGFLGDILPREDPYAPPCLQNCPIHTYSLKPYKGNNDVNMTSFENKINIYFQK